MRRIGVLVALLLLVLAGALTLLVGRALQSVASEQAMRHEVLAERVFDEIEEQLTTLIDAEEARPFLQYRFFYVPEGQVPGTVGLSRSPLSEVPQDPWLLGWFQVDPDGSVSTPLEPEDAEFASESIGWADSEELRGRSSRLKLAGAALASTVPPRVEGERFAANLPGKALEETTIELGRGKQELPMGSVAPAGTPLGKESPAGLKSKDKDAGELADGWSGLDAGIADGTKADAIEAKKKSEARGGEAKNADPYGIGTLNTGASKRGERQQRVTKTSAENVRNYQYPADNEALVKGNQLPEVGFDGDTATTIAAAGSATDAQGSSGLLGGLRDLVTGSARRSDVSGGAVERPADVAAQSSEAQSTREVASAELATGEDEEDLELAAVESEVAAALEEEAFAPEPNDQNVADDRAPASRSGARRTNRPLSEAKSSTLEAKSSATEERSSPALRRGGATSAPAASTSAPASAPAVAVKAPPPAPAPQKSIEQAELAQSAPAELSRAEPEPAQSVTDAIDGVASVDSPTRAAWMAVPEPRSSPDAGGAPAAAARPVATPRKAPVPKTSGRKEPAFAAREEVDVEISPLRGRLVDDETLVLFRTVRIGDQQYVQGLALLLPLLQTWLEEQVLAGSELSPFLRLLWGADPDAAALVAPLADFHFAHTFAEPFTALAATAHLRALPETSGSGRAAILQLAVLLVVVGLLGVFALWRMVSVVVQFAERRQNFVAAVSHELKTPLTSIRMYSEMLRDGYVQTEEKRSEYYATMSAESERLSRLIQNVLELSRLENDGGGGSGEVVVGALGPVLEEAARVLERHAAERGFSIVLDLPPGLPAVRFERDGLLQVLINLLDNGIKFSTEAALREVRVEARTEGGRVVLRVRDHGPGVPARQLGHIFQPFYRGERELTRRTKGTGIGLALVKGIIERMGGSVTARNHPDGGFEVKVALAAA